MSDIQLKHTGLKFTKPLTTSIIATTLTDGKQSITLDAFPDNPVFLDAKNDVLKEGVDVTLTPIESGQAGAYTLSYADAKPAKAPAASKAAKSSGPISCAKLSNDFD